jgi:hypothetical protein
MNVQCYHDSPLDLPQFRVDEDVSDPFDVPDHRWIADINCAIYALAAKWPWTRGMYCGHDPYAQVCAVYEFLNECTRRNSINYDLTAYALKHHVEGVSKRYISVGYFAVAAQLQGLWMRPNRDKNTFRFNLCLDLPYYRRLQVLSGRRYLE